METKLHHNNKLGVLITGNPGSGKSAFLSNLLCSNVSSPIIHSRIFGYHFCMHFNKWTRSGAKFVGNLANMIALRVTEYRQVILTDLSVRGVLNKDCSQDPEWCFEQAILRPLKKLKQQPIEPWYIVIDALDEKDAKAEILNILKTKARRFPRWLKLIVSSRNVTSIVANMDELQRLDLRSDDRRNLEDTDTYISLKVFPLKEFIVQRITIAIALAITDNEAPTQNIVCYLYEFLLGKENWKKYLQTENAIFDYFIDRYEDQNYKGNVETVRTGDGPLTLAILSHPMGVNVIDERFDAEGYNALHRAAQGANLNQCHSQVSLLRSKRPT